jgi:hypothetical protein
VKEVYHGYIMVLPVDARWIDALDPLECAKMIVRSDDTLGLYHVNMDYDLYDDLDAFDDELTISAMEAADEQRNTFKKKAAGGRTEFDTDRLYAKTVFKFLTPEDSEDRAIKLTVQPIAEDEDEVTLPLEPFEISVSTVEHTHMKSYICFWIARDDIHPRRRGKDETAPEKPISTAKKKLQAKRQAKAAMKTE